MPRSVRYVVLVCAVTLMIAACARNELHEVRDFVGERRAGEGRTQPTTPSPVAGRTPPVAPRNASAAPRPSAEASVVVFFSPHPDDESLGMGHAIARYVRAGWTVYVGLLTDGEDSRDYALWYRRRPELWRDLNGNGVAGDPEDFGLERKDEFLRACTALGVRRSNLLFFNSPGRGHSKDSPLDVVLAARMTRISEEFERAHPGATQITTMAYIDGKLNGPGDFLPQEQHRIACVAVAKTARRLRFPAWFYKVYAYYLKPDQRWAPIVERDAPDHGTKRRALLEGYDTAERSHHLAIGWHSVPLLFENALMDENEYVTPLSDFR